MTAKERRDEEFMRQEEERCWDTGGSVCDWVEANGGSTTNWLEVWALTGLWVIAGLIVLALIRSVIKWLDSNFGQPTPLRMPDPKPKSSNSADPALKPASPTPTFPARPTAKSESTFPKPVFPARPAPVPEPTPAPAAVKPPAEPSFGEQRRQWAAVRKQLREHLNRMAQYEINPALAIDFPAFNDVSVPEVSAMTKAYRAATGLEDSTDKKAPVGGSTALLDRFAGAVHDFGTAVDIAEQAARRLRWSHLPETDRKDLSKIQGLLNHAMNPGNTDEARHSYYAQLQRSIRKLNDRHGIDVVPAGAMNALEAKARLELDST